MRCNSCCDYVVLGCAKTILMVTALICLSGSTVAQITAKDFRAVRQAKSAKADTQKSKSNDSSASIDYRKSSIQLAGAQLDEPVIGRPVRYQYYNRQEGLDSRPKLELPRASDDRASGDQEGQVSPLEATAKWPAKSIREIRIDIREAGGRIPEDRSYELAGFGGSPTPVTSAKVFAWAAPNLRYQPLYFEDVALERYGQTRPSYRQGVASGIHFFRSLVLIPHQMRHDHPASCDYPLGFCRPGSQVPYTIQRQFFGR